VLRVLVVRQTDNFHHQQKKKKERKIGEKNKQTENRSTDIKSFEYVIHLNESRLNPNSNKKDNLITEKKIFLNTSSPPKKGPKT